jgi:hypothetical protein
MRTLRVAALLFGLCLLAFPDASDTDGSVVPEPSMVVVMGAALAAIGAVTWRRNRKK